MGSPHAGHGGREIARLSDPRFGDLHDLVEFALNMDPVLVMMPLHSRRGRRDAEMLERATSLLIDVGLAHRLNHAAPQLSGGEQQRVAVARALVVEPALVLADEPTGNLDTESGAQVLELLRYFNRTRGTAFLIVTHDERIAAICGRIVHLVDGRIDSDRRRVP